MFEGIKYKITKMKKQQKTIKNDQTEIAGVHRLCITFPE